MSSEALVWAKAARTGSASRKAVLIILAEYADEAGTCFPGQKRVAHETELGERTVRRVMAELEDAGFIVREERRREDGYRTSDRIRLRLEQISPATVAGSGSGTSPANDDSLTGHSRQISPATVAGQEPLEGTTRGTTSSPPTPQRLVIESGNGLSRISLPATAPAFDRFWVAYPRHVGKRTAAAAWERACRRADPEAIIAGAVAYRNDPNREEQFTAHPATWLNRDGWDDDPLPARSSSKHTAGGDGLRAAANIVRRGTVPTIERRPPPALPTGDPDAR